VGLPKSHLKRAHHFTMAREDNLINNGNEVGVAVSLGLIESNSIGIKENY